MLACNILVYNLLSFFPVLLPKGLNKGSKRRNLTLVVVVVLMFLSPRQGAFLLLLLFGWSSAWIGTGIRKILKTYFWFKKKQLSIN